jgi:hypothetical protein
MPLHFEVPINSIIDVKVLKAVVVKIPGYEKLDNGSALYISMWEEADTLCYSTK